jgi:DinB family protein
MKRRRWMGVMLAAVIGFAVSGTAHAQDASTADKEKALALLESSKKGVLAATKGLSEAQWNFKPAPEKWSIAQCMEHIAAAEDFIRGMIVENVMKAPAAPDRDVAKIDAGKRTGPHHQGAGSRTFAAHQPLRFTGSRDQTLCGEPRDN